MVRILTKEENMKKSWMKRAAAVGLSVMMIGGLSACGSQKNAVDATEVFASVDDNKDMQVTMDVANFMARYSQAMYETYYMSYLGDDMWTQSAGEDQTYEDTVKSSVSTSVEEMLVLRANAEKYGVTLSDEEEASIEEAAKQFMEDNTDEDGNTVISASEDVVKQVLELYTYRTKMYNELVKDVDLEVSDEEALQKAMGYIHFEDDEEDSDTSSDASSDTDSDSKDSSDASSDTDAASKDSSDSSETKELRTAKEKADEFYAGLQAGKDFKEYAEELGYDPVETAFDETTTSPNEDTIKAVWSLKEGEYTDIIETEDSGCYIALLTSDFDKEATEAQKDNIREDRKSDAYTEAVAELKENTKVTVNEDLLDDIDFTKQGVTMHQEETADDSADSSADDSTESTDSSADDSADSSAENTDSSADE